MNSINSPQKNLLRAIPLFSTSPIHIPAPPRIQGEYETPNKRASFPSTQAAEMPEPSEALADPAQQGGGGEPLPGAENCIRTP